MKTLKTGEGYDAATDEFGNMIKQGIIDPVKVTRSALENAVSIAGMVLTTNCLVTEIPEKKARARSRDVGHVLAGGTREQESKGTDSS